MLRALNVSSMSIKMSKNTVLECLYQCRAHRQHNRYSACFAGIERHEPTSPEYLKATLLPQIATLCHKNGQRSKGSILFGLQAKPRINYKLWRAVVGSSANPPGYVAAPSARSHRGAACCFLWLSSPFRAHTSL